MDLIWDGLRDAVRMLADNDSGVYEIALRSLYVSGTATLIALALGVGIGAALAFRQFRGRLIVLALVNTGMGLPPVVIGLIVAILLWRSGPLGELGWIYEPQAMIIAQIVIATPVITGFTAASLAALPAKLRLQVYALGASRRQMLWLLLQEVRLPLLAALMAGFGAAISEVGASVMVGGNLEGDTRVLTGAILLEQSRGNFGAALAFGIILLGMMVAVNVLFTWVQLGRRRDVQRSDDRPQIDGAASAYLWTSR
jgi:tungstate transport system permease protein